jgi:hypothetical protein
MFCHKQSAKTNCFVSPVLIRDRSDHPACPYVHVNFAEGPDSDRNCRRNSRSSSGPNKNHINIGNAGARSTTEAVALSQLETDSHIAVLDELQPTRTEVDALNERHSKTEEASTRYGWRGPGWCRRPAEIAALAEGRLERHRHAWPPTSNHLHAIHVSPTTPARLIPVLAWTISGPISIGVSVVADWAVAGRRARRPCRAASARSGYSILPSSSRCSCPSTMGSAK